MQRLPFAQYLPSGILANSIKVAFAGLVISLAFVAQLDAAERLAVKIIDRKDSTTQYTYVVPGRSKTKSQAKADCFGTDSTASCSGTEESKTTSTPSQIGTYEVQGATFSLALPDGRIVVVNCESKPVWGGTFRSCRMPLVDDIQAEFKGNKAKLFWPVSIDGKKWESETYKILGVLQKQQ